MSAGFAVSVQVRLVRHAHDLKIDPNMVLARYAAAWKPGGPWR